MRKKEARKILAKVQGSGKILFSEITLEEVMAMEKVSRFPRGNVYEIRKGKFSYQIAIYKDGKILVKKFEKQNR